MRAARAGRGRVFSTSFVSGDSQNYRAKRMVRLKRLLPRSPLSIEVKMPGVAQGLTTRVLFGPVYGGVSPLVIVEHFAMKHTELDYVYPKY